jgi:predicted secreted protein
MTTARLLIVLLVIANSLCFVKRDFVRKPPIEIVDVGNGDENRFYNINIKKKMQVYVKLHGSPGTGYGWYLKNKDAFAESNLIEFVNSNKYNGSDDYQSDPNPGHMFGVGGTYTFIIKTLNSSPKPVQIIFVYKRPWMKEDLKTVLLQLNIQ